MQTSPIEKHFLLALLVLTIILALAIFYPFLTMVVLAAAFAVVLSPVYLWLKHHMTRGISWIASLLTVMLFIVLLCGPLFAIGTVVFDQVQNTYDSMIATGDTDTFIKALNTSINKIMPAGFTFDTKAKIIDMVAFLSNNIAGFFASTFRSIMMFVLMLLSIFYLLKDGNQWKNNFIRLLPLSENHANEILLKLEDAINRILKGSFFIAIVQGIFVSIGLTIFGVPNGAIWGVVAGIASFIPTIGTSVVAVPAVLFLYFTGMQIEALGLFIWSIFLVGMIDNVLSPYVISKNTEISSLFILFSILGGISLMGGVGVLIGPLVLSLLYSLVSIYRKEVR